MHKMLERYFALEKAVKDGIEPDTKPDGTSWCKPVHCLTCYAEKNWQDKLSVILQQHGVDLEAFAKEHFPHLGNWLFTVQDCKLRLTHDIQCVDVKSVLKVAASLLPEN